MENNTVVLTQLSIPEIRQLFRQELTTFFSEKFPSAQTGDQDKPLTVQEVSILLDIKPPTIYAHVGQKTIPHYKKGGRLYFSRTELTEWVKSGRKKTAEEIREEAVKTVGVGRRGRL